MSTEPDPRFLGGEQAVLTDTRDMALVVAFNWDGAVDIAANVPKPEAARLLRLVADQFDPPPTDPADELRLALAVGSDVAREDEEARRIAEEL